MGRPRLTFLPANFKIASSASCSLPNGFIDGSSTPSSILSICSDVGSNSIVLTGAIRLVIFCNLLGFGLTLGTLDCIIPNSFVESNAKSWNSGNSVTFVILCIDVVPLRADLNDGILSAAISAKGSAASSSIGSFCCLNVLNSIPDSGSSTKGR